MRRVAKKLTDCPENLRESIDWLIQVRYGNGGNDGLGELAKALKKLIEEAIKKAYDSVLDIYAKHLDKVWQRHDCCKEKFTAIEQLQTKLKESKSTNFTSLNDHLSKIIYEKNVCEQNHYIDSSKDTALKNLDSRFIKDPETLLTQLCSGVEAFLGFSPTSKGYTGQGIVYSDLDRLCDAVMAFLSGVLSAVKNENEVTTYDKNDDNNIKTVIKKLEGSIGSGRAGLAASVEQVRSWLEGYGKNVNDKTESIKKRLNGLIRSINYQKEKFLNPEKNSLQEQLNSWNEALGSITQHMGETEHDHINRLDEVLKNKVDNEWKQIKTAVDVMKRFSGDDDLKSLNDVAKRQLEELKIYLQSKVVERLLRIRNDFQRDLKDKIQLPIDDVKNKLEDARKMLSDWIYRAYWAVRKAMVNVNAIVKVLEGKEEQTEEERNSQTPNKFTAVNNAAKKLHDDANKLWKVVEEVKQGLSGLVEGIKAKVDGLEAVYKATLKALRSTVQVNVVAAQGTLGELENTLKVDLSSTVKQQIQEEIEKVIKEVQKGIKNAGENAIGGNSRSLIEEFYDGMSKDDVPALREWCETAKAGGLYNALDILRGSFRTREFTTFKAFLTRFPALTESIGSREKTFFGAIIADLEKKLIDAISTITGKLGTYMKNYNNHAKNAVGGTIYDAMGQVRKNADDYFDGIDGSGDIKEGKLNDRGYKRSGGGGAIELLHKEIEKVETNRKALETAKGSDDITVFDKSTFSSQFESFVKSLTAFTTAVKELLIYGTNKGTDKDSVDHYLDDLYKMIEQKEKGHVKLNAKYGNNSVPVQGLRKIEQDILGILESNVNGNLKSIIGNASNFYNKIQQDVDNCIGLLKSDVQEQVQSGTTKITEEAQRLYAERKKSELHELRKLIENQKSAIEHIIATDSASGLKGLLSRMRGENQYALEKINQNSHAVTNLADVLRNYFYFLFWFIEGQVKSSPSSQLVAALQTRTYALLSHLHKNQRPFTFDSGFLTRLHELTSALSTFDPATFANPNHPQLLDALKAGMNGLVKEMEKAYVNRYCGHTKMEWTTQNKEQKKEPTADATRCAKVFMSCLPMLLNDLSKVKEKCQRGEEWNKLKINFHSKNKLGPFLKSCGYSVASDVPLQDGELQNSSKMKGEHIHGILNETILISSHTHVPQCKPNGKEHNFIILDFIRCLNDHLDEYYRVWHYATFTASKHPSTICDMLQWLTGLTHSPVYDALSHQGFSDLFEKDEANEQKVAEGISFQVAEDESLDAYPQKIKASELGDILTEVCHHAEETLISFLGHGHSGGIYACEFNTNSAKLTYPSDPSKCLDLLFEVIGRVYNQLFFLFKQCSYSTKLGGWYDCWYGQGVGGSAWNCNTLQCPAQSTNQQADQKHNQTCNQNCDQSAECGLKSPLQSFLEDGLPGFLPHPYSKSDCKPTCTAPGHFGKVCITPMGFGDISGMASRRQQGRHIMEVLNEFCGSEHAPLSRLCGLLTCLLTRPPQTLGDMFAFYYNFLNGWHDPKFRDLLIHRELPYAAAVKSANFERDGNRLEVSSIFNTTKHITKNGSTHSKGDLCSLVTCDQNTDPVTHCGRYLQSFGGNKWAAFSYKYADKYLSWIVYLTETFYDLLKMLYDDCNNKCGQDYSKCNRTSCVGECPTKSDKPKSYEHLSGCRTIVTCKSTLPTLCRYGFVFDSPHSLSGEYGDDKKRTCKDFCKALENVLNINEKDEHVLAKLIYVTIPEFLFKIRAPFIWLNVALWLLSLLYLTHIMVIRLDLFHIKSHLHSPSSHRIAAQSLLAAGRVNKLGKVFYLQP